MSVVSLWEITIKYRLGKLSLETDLKTVLTDYIYQNGFVLLPIEIGHFLALDQMPMHHRDPFDRMLISQCVADNMSCVSDDSEFVNYHIEVIW